MASRFCSLQLHLSLICALLLAGCADIPVAPPDSRTVVEKARALREMELQMTWVGQPYEDLVMAFGKPGMVMNVPAFRPWKVSVVVYEGLDSASDCIDAFTVAHNGMPVIDDYFCR